MELTVVPESFPKHHWPVEKPQLKLNGLMTFIAVILGLIAGLFNTVGIYLLTVYYLLPFEFVLPGNLVSRFILFLIGFIFAIYLSILFYEGSQILVGVLLGYRASLLQVGPLALVRTATGWRLRRISQEFLLLGGVNYCGPLTTKQLRLRYIIYALSGYLLTFLLWYVLLISGSALPADNVPRWLAILLDLLMISTTYALWHKLLSTVNGVAIAFSRHPSDFNQLRLVMLATLSISGVRPREIDPVEIATSVADAKNTPQESSALLLAYEHAADSGRLEEATCALNQALQALYRCPTVDERINVMLAAADYEVTYGQNPQRAYEWLAHCQIQDTSPLAHEAYQRYLQIKAALLLAEGEGQAARSTALESQVMLKRTIDLGFTPVLTEKLNVILSQTFLVDTLSPYPIAQPIPVAKVDSPLQPKARILGNIYDWASFAFIYFLLINFNIVAGSQSMVHKYLGDRYASIGQYQQAIVEYTKANTAFPEWATGLTERGKVYSVQGDYQRSVADFSQVIERTPFADEELYLRRGAAYYYLGEQNLAEADFTQALALASKSNKQQVLKIIQQIRDADRDDE